MRRIVSGFLLFVAVATMVSVFGVTYRYSTTTTTTFTTTSKETGFEGSWGWVVTLLVVLFAVTFYLGLWTLVKRDRPNQPSSKRGQ